MDFVDRFTQHRFRNISPSVMFKFGHLDVRVQRHLQKVYTTLAAALLVAAVGCLADMQWRVSGLVSTLGALGCIIGLTITPATPQMLNRRYALLGGMAFLQGAALGPLISLATFIDPTIPLTAIAATAVLFVSFTLASLVTKRRAYLYLGGYLSSAVLALSALRIARWALGGQGLGAWSYELELLGGLAVFAGYVIFDTQMIVERAHAGDFDHVRHALDMLVDVLAIFVRILAILIRNAEKRERQRQEDERKRR